MATKYKYLLSKKIGDYKDLIILLDKSYSSIHESEDINDAEIPTLNISTTFGTNFGDTISGVTFDQGVNKWIFDTPIKKSDLTPIGEKISNSIIIDYNFLNDNTGKKPNLNNFLKIFGTEHQDIWSQHQNFINFFTSDNVFVNLKEIIIKLIALNSVNPDACLKINSFLSSKLSLGVLNVINTIYTVDFKSIASEPINLSYLKVPNNNHKISEIFKKNYTLESFLHNLVSLTSKKQKYRVDIEESKKQEILDVFLTLKLYINSIIKGGRKKDIEEFIKDIGTHIKIETGLPKPPIQKKLNDLSESYWHPIDINNVYFPFSDPNSWNVQTGGYLKWEIDSKTKGHHLGIQTILTHIDNYMKNIPRRIDESPFLNVYMKNSIDNNIVGRPKEISRLWICVAIKFNATKDYGDEDMFNLIDRGEYTFPTGEKIDIKSLLFTDPNDWSKITEKPSKYKCFIPLKLRPTDKKTKIPKNSVTINEDNLRYDKCSRSSFRGQCVEAKEPFWRFTSKQVHVFDKPFINAGFGNKNHDHFGKIERLSKKTPQLIRIDKTNNAFHTEGYKTSPGINSERGGKGWRVLKGIATLGLTETGGVRNYSHDMYLFRCNKYYGVTKNYGKYVLLADNPAADEERKITINISDLLKNDEFANISVLNETGKGILRRLIDISVQPEPETIPYNWKPTTTSTRRDGNLNLQLGCYQKKCYRKKDNCTNKLVKRASQLARIKWRLHNTHKKTIKKKQADMLKFKAGGHYKRKSNKRKKKRTKLKKKTKNI